MKKILSFSSSIKKDSIICLCPMRNEEHILHSFLDHYYSHGVSHFVFFDNLSDDNTINILKDLSSKYNIEAYICEESFIASKWGSNWANDFMQKYCIDNWCITIDADEFFMPKNNQKIIDLISNLEARKLNSARSILVDMYPKNLNSVHNQTIESSCFFDRFNEIYYKDGYSDFGQKYVMGGLRKRVYDSFNMISKCSLFKNEFYLSHHVSGGWHWIKPLSEFYNFYLNNIAIAPVSSTSYFDKKSYLEAVKKSLETVRDTEAFCALLHYKFLRKDIYAFFQERVERNQDWNDSEEYKNYISQKETSLFHERYSVDSSDNINLVYSELIDKL
jgi:hypothetical protein